MKMAAVCPLVCWGPSVMGSMTVGMDPMRCTVVSFSTLHTSVLSGTQCYLKVLFHALTVRHLLPTIGLFYRLYESRMQD